MKTVLKLERVNQKILITDIIRPDLLKDKEITTYDERAKKTYNRWFKNNKVVYALVLIDYTFGDLKLLRLLINEKDREYETC